MRARLLIPVLLAAPLLNACSEEEREPGPPPNPRTTVIDAAEKALAQGPSRLRATLRSARVRYRLNGRLDPRGGYRVCAAMVAAPSRYLRNRSLWLDGRAGSYGTLNAPGPRCAGRGLWFDDHPPTVPLYGSTQFVQPLGGTPGGEDFLHAALVVLTGLAERTVTATRAGTCPRTECYRVEVDFAALDQKPKRRDEDGWTLRPLLRSLARHPVDVRIDADGFLYRLSFSARRPIGRRSRMVRVGIQLSAFGEEQPVPLAGTNRIAIE